MPTANYIISSFYNISPINTVEEGISRGRFQDQDPFIDNQTVPLWPAAGEKTVHVVCFNKETGNCEYPELLWQIRMRPCRDAPNYFLGLMAQWPEDQMASTQLSNTHIVAAEPDGLAASFYNSEGDNCYLYANRRGLVRGLFLMDKEGAKWPENFGFLAEDLAP